MDPSSRTFLSNFRQAVQNIPLSSGNNIPLSSSKNVPLAPASAVPLTADSALKQTAQKESLDRFSRDIDEGKVKGTQSHADKEEQTVRYMDSLYHGLSLDFQKEFYPTHFNAETEGEMSDDEVLRESTQWLDNAVKSRGLDKMKMPNGKTFVENFRKYGYSKNLLPDPQAEEMWVDSEDSGYMTTGSRFRKVFPQLLPSAPFFGNNWPPHLT